MELRNCWIQRLALLILFSFGISVSGSSPLSYEYYLLNPNITADNLSVISLSETNKIKGV